MPFTASHVAAVLPFVRTPLIPSALVVGSILPDRAVLFPVSVYGYSHSVSGVFGTNALVGFVVLAAWHVLLAEPLCAMSPAALRRRLPVTVPGAWLATSGWPRRLLLTYASLVIGAGTHVMWDEFTHPNRWGSQHIAWLAASHGPMLGTTWAQYGCSALGAIVIAIWLTLWWRRTPPREAAVTGSKASWAIWLLPLVAGAGAAAVAARAVLAGGAGPRQAAFWIAASATSTGLTVVVVLALGWQLNRVLRTA